MNRFNKRVILLKHYISHEIAIFYSILRDKYIIVYKEVTYLNSKSDLDHFPSFPFNCLNIFI